MTIVAGIDAETQKVGNVEVSNRALHMASIGVLCQRSATQAGQKLTITAASQDSNAIPTRAVSVTADTACFIEIDASPTAVVDTSYPILPDAHYHFTCDVNDIVAFIGTSGNIWITPIEA